MNTAEGGGGGGATGFVVDAQSMTDCATGLEDAASGLEDAGATRPSGAGTGMAEPLLLMVLAAASQTAGRLAFESVTLGQAVAACNTDAATTYSAIAAGMLTVEGEGERPARHRDRGARQHP